MTLRSSLKGAALALATGVLAAAAPASAATLYAGNGHLYEFVAQNVSWQTALASAASWTPIAGYTSYLATITDVGEDNFIKALTGAATYVWVAGSDDAVEGVWKWVAGPEAGQIFYGPGAAPGAYSHWNAGEPNNSNTENFLHIKANTGDWNDIYGTFPSGGYVVEYSLSGTGGVPEPAVWMTMILGFAAAGAALRRRRAGVVA